MINADIHLKSLSQPWTIQLVNSLHVSYKLMVLEFARFFSSFSTKEIIFYLSEFNFEEMIEYLQPCSCTVYKIITFLYWLALLSSFKLIPNPLLYQIISSNLPKFFHQFFSNSVHYFYQNFVPFFFSKAY